MQLLVIDGRNVAAPYTLADERWYSFGKAPDNEIVIDSGLVSKHHGRIGVFQGRCWIQDLGSTNGILVGGRLYRGQGLELGPGDLVRIGTDHGSHGLLGAMLAIAQGGQAWGGFSLSPGRTYTIGRDPSADIRLDRVTVSRRHGELMVDQWGNCSLTSYGTNGTLVNGQMVQGWAQVPDRSQILVANVELYLCGSNLFYLKRTVGPRLEAHQLTRDVKTKGGMKRILDGVELTIEPGQFVAIVGGSGCGKSTLLNALTGYERASSGSVLIGGQPLYQNYDHFKSLMGFVPQQDIIYDHLRLDEMLDYSAKLRMPKDTSPQERRERVEQVLDMVELREHGGTMVKKLSGGQRKRASIAVELLADPGLFYLDEPTSGLDPGTERSLMKTLRRLSSEKNKTVIMVTHTTLNLHMCDKIVFMGKGGKLCFCGAPQEAMSFFGVRDLVDVYDMVARDTDRWWSAYRAMGRNAAQAPGEQIRLQRKKRPSWLKQTGILSRRYMKLILNDRGRLIMLCLEPVIMGLILFACKGEEVFETYLDTKNILFTYVCCAIWIGIFNSVQEVCKERAILKREYMAGLRLGSYISSKFLVQALLCFIQSLLLCTVFSLLVGSSEEGMLLEASFPEDLISTFLTILSASCMGLCLSSVAKDPDKAMTLSPFLLVVQLVFAGIIFKLEGVVEDLSYLTLSRWSIGGLGTTAGLEEMYYSSGAFMTMGSRDEATVELFTATGENLMKCWGVLLGYGLVYCLVSMLLLRNISKDSR